MAPRIDMVGKTYNFWYVNNFAGKNKNGYLVDCTCLKCNKHYIRDASSIRKGASRMCADCFRESDEGKIVLENAHEKCRKHNLGASKIYKVLHGMHKRCEDKTFKSYNIYGGRGIKVCDEWSVENVEMFAEWAYSHGYKEGLQIDRIDTNGNYEPSNCRWVTRKENARNTRTNRIVTVFGEQMTLAEAAERYGKVQYKVVHRRMKRGMTLEEALFTPNYWEERRKQKAIGGACCE